jgi:glycosyltransferase involved in cell wall biosynthesis
MITYNHEQYVEQAVRSALMQQTSFDFEIVIGEDCSTDRTLEIVRELQQAHPSMIRVLARDQNIGVQRNFVETFSACSGQYIALLEGDDFWTSPQKLQKQADFLDAHPECALCFHKAGILREDAEGQLTFLPESDIGEIESIELLLGNANPIATCSAVVRNRLFSTFPEWFYTLKFGDWPLHILNAHHGAIGYIPEVMATYRVHASGLWSSQRPEQTLRHTVEMFSRVNEHFKFEYNAAIAPTIANLARHWAWYLMTSLDMGAREKVLRDLAATSDAGLIYVLFDAMVAMAIDLQRSKTWVEEQYHNWQAEAERLAAQLETQRMWIAELERTKAWLEEQRAWLKQVEQARDYHSQQAQNWQAAAREHHQQAQHLQTVVARQAEEIAQLRQRLDRRIIPRLRRAGARMRHKIQPSKKGR